MNHGAAIQVEQVLEELAPKRRFEAYPDYRDSGIEGIQAVPAHWPDKPLKYVAAANAHKLADATAPDYELEYVDIGNVSLIDGVTSTETYRFENAPSRARRRVQPGDTIISTVRTYLKAVARIDNPPENLVVSTGFAVLHAGPELAPAYLYRLVQSDAFVERVVAHSVGVSYPAINASDLVRLPIPIPTLDEQRTIAAFLDRETARIDELIAKKQRLIELLAEKRTALISHTVTKGLNPNAPMKESGVDWLGKVPVHWEVKKFKYAIAFQEGPGIMAVDFRDEGVPLLRISNLTPGHVSLEGCNFLAPEKVRQRWPHFRVQAGDFLISCSATTGIVSTVGTDAVGAVPYTGIIRLWPAHKDMYSRFIPFLVASQSYLEQIDSLKAGVAIQHYGPVHLRKVIAVFPPREEQEQITNFLDEDCDRIEKLSGNVDAAILKLCEYRSALISAAVTGKIDVRGFQPKEAPCQ